MFAFESEISKSAALRIAKYSITKRKTDAGVQGRGNTSAGGGPDITVLITPGLCGRG